MPEDLTFKFDEKLNRVLVTLGKVPANIKRWEKATLEDLAKVLEDSIKKLAPEKTGDYKTSWETTGVNGSIISVETPFGELFIILEFQGSNPHKIEAAPGGVLAFPDEAGNTVFTVRVNHPGFEPIPHVRQSIKVMLKAAPKIVFENMDRHIKIW